MATIDQIVRFVPSTLFTMDSMGHWDKDINTVEELVELINDESAYWFGGDNRNECEEKLVKTFNRMVSELMDGRSPSDSFKLNDTTYRFSAK